MSNFGRANGGVLNDFLKSESHRKADENESRYHHHHAFIISALYSALWNQSLERRCQYLS